MRRSQAQRRTLSRYCDERLRPLPPAWRRFANGAPHSALCAQRRRRYGSAMRKPITKNRKSPQKSCLVLSAQTVDTSADTPAASPVVTVGAQASQNVTTARLDKQETIELARATLQSICLSADAPSNAKATAARSLLELVGALGRHADPSSMNTIPASEMSLEQLEARIASLASH
jgi:hypothetical protein